MHVYIINWIVVHRQYLCNCLHIISLLVETSVPLVHETMDTVSEESLGLRAEPFFNGFSDLIVVCEPASLQWFFLVARTHGNRRATGRGCRGVGVMENFPSEVLQQIFANFCHMRTGIVLLDLVLACPLYSHVHDENHYTIGKLQYMTYTQSHAHSSFDCKCQFY